MNWWLATIVCPALLRWTLRAIGKVVWIEVKPDTVKDHQITVLIFFLVISNPATAVYVVFSTRQHTGRKIGHTLSSKDFVHMRINLFLGWTLGTSVWLWGIVAIWNTVFALATETGKSVVGGHELRGSLERYFDGDGIGLGWEPISFPTNKCVDERR